MSAERIKEQLEAAGIKRSLLQLGEWVRTVPEAAAAIGVADGQVAKSILFQSKDCFALFVAAGDNKISNRKVRKILAAKSARIALPETVLHVTGYAVGAVSPLGLLEPLPIFIDETLARYGEIYAGGGSQQALLPLSYKELVLLTGGRAVDLKAE
ncbi:YbaK/EbsC family protein [Azotosporobacter soli]|uniref:YbaK/EbsC family protein n=1 Tax=Azotosporobacter soli TaxID=3055040 RepID=UPI0031FF2EEF